LCVNFVAQVCEEQKCQEDIFPLAVNYMDRFLSVNPINKNHLQLLGTTCLLVSSKLRESDCLSVDLLVLYTDNTITSEELLVSRVCSLYYIHLRVIIIILNPMVGVFLSPSQRIVNCHCKPIVLVSSPLTIVCLCSTTRNFCFFFLFFLEQLDI